MNILKYKEILKLKWDVDMKISGSTPYNQIISDPIKKVHMIRIAKNNTNQIEELHEFCHAKMAEDYGVQFSTSYFDKKYTDEIINAVMIGINPAQDWFVDEIVKNTKGKEYIEHLKDSILLVGMMKLSGPVNQLVNVGCSLITAQYIREGNNLPKDEIVKVFLEFDPQKPSLAALESLANSIFDVIGFNHKIKFVEHRITIK